MVARLETVNFFDYVHEQISLVEDRMREQSNGHHPDLEMALHHLLNSGGKRIRPTVALLVGGMLGAKREHVVTLAAAVELLHTATLVHDDVIDGSLLRRGSPTLNARWSPGATILTGDFIFARAAKLAAETESIDVMKLFAKTLSVITPYPPVGDDNVRQFFSEIGFEVKNICGLNCASATAIAETPIGAVLDAVRQVDGDDVDVIIQCGTNLSTIDLFPTLEHTLEKPLIPINVATIWHALRSCGIDDKVTGKGRLMEEF